MLVVSIHSLLQVNKVLVLQPEFSLQKLDIVLAQQKLLLHLFE